LFRKHDKDSAFLGYTKTQSDKWLDEIQSGRAEKDSEKLQMF